MKQNVGAPVAVIAIFLVLLASAVYFSQPRFNAASGEKPLILPSEPPLDEDQLKSLDQALDLLGIRCVMPPLDSDNLRGARVAMVAPGSPAEAGGMKPGDFITRFGRATIGVPMGVAAAVMQSDPTKPIAVVVVRAGKEVNLTITGIKPPLREEQMR